MTVETERRTSLRVVMAFVAVAVGVSATSFGISRARITSDREAGRVIADSLEAERSASTQAASRRQQLEALLARVEQQLQSKPLDSMLIRSAGNLAYDLGKFDVAARYYRVFLDSIDANIVEVAIDLGYAVFESGNPDEGRRIIESVIQKYPNNQVALYNLGIMYLRSNDVDAGRHWLQRCMDIDRTSDAGKRAAEILTSLSTAS